MSKVGAYRFTMMRGKGRACVCGRARAYRVCRRAIGGRGRIDEQVAIAPDGAALDRVVAHGVGQVQQIRYPHPGALRSPRRRTPASCTARKTGRWEFSQSPGKSLKTK